MADSNPALVLARWLDTLPAEQRHEMIAFLLAGRSGGAAPPVPQTLLQATRRQLASTLVGGEDHQLVTIRMPTELHVTLRDWCTAHNFTMAAVIRGLVERFLEEQSRAAPDGPPSA